MSPFDAGSGNTPGSSPDPSRAEAGSRTSSQNKSSSAQQRVGSEEGGQDSLIPKLELPRGGGALRGIGESFSANAFTGTGTLTIPVPVSPARALTPELSVSYDSGSGNGPFGLGMSLSLPSISRRTDRGLPQYRDSTESDTFVLAGAEDLVPVFDGAGTRVVHVTETHRVYPYRPRVEGSFLRIERWVLRANNETHWRVTDRDNVVSVFGESTNGRVANPEHTRNVFQWNLERRYDDRGNVVFFEYVAEDLENVDMHALPEVDRIAKITAQAERYVKRVRYGNRVTDPEDPGDFMFEVVLDYGEHGEDTGTAQADITAETVRVWPARLDTFSSFRGGFDVRTRRLCRRVLVFHRFEALSGEGAPPRLVRSIDFAYEEAPNVTLLTGVTARGYVFDANTGFYDVESLPTVTLGYSARVLPVVGEVQHAAAEAHAASIADVGSSGLGTGRLRLVDLNGEGIPGLLLEQSQALYYKRAEGEGRYAPAYALPSRPSLGTAQRLMDLDGDGNLDLVVMKTGGPSGSFRRDSFAEAWQEFRSFASVPKGFSLDTRGVELLDLDGDGLADIVHNEGRRLTWYRSRGLDGWVDPWPVSLSTDEHEGPQFSRGDPHSVTLYADMTGDGLTDVVLVQNGFVCYWPNLGRGRFGRRITMQRAPFFGSGFDPRRLRLEDIDGTGPADIVYVDDDGAHIYFNEAGNGFSEPVHLAGFPAVHTLADFQVADVYGKGTAALVYTSRLTTERSTHLRTLDLLPEGKPYLLTNVQNGLGRETSVHYTSSTEFYLADRRAGQPWATRLPFPVHVIDRVEVIDHPRGHRVATTYSYHHGYFDGPEREFRGFGRVDTRDTESFQHYGDDVTLPTGHHVSEGVLHVPPVLTRTWFHTGAYLTRGSLTQAYAREYWQGDEDAPGLLFTRLPSNIRGDERREACRALRGRPVRQEVFSEDGTEAEGRPYLVTEYAYTLRPLQGKVPKDRQNLDLGRHHGVFFVHDEETRSYHYERVVEDPRLMQSLVLAVDAFGNIERTAEVAYPRRIPQAPAEAEQALALVVVSENDWVNQPGTLDTTYRLGAPMETRSRELVGFEAPNPGAPWTPAAVATLVDGATLIDFEDTPGEGVSARLLERTQVRYWNDALDAALPHGQVGARALVHETWARAFSEDLIDAVNDGHVASLGTVLTNEGGYVSFEDAWWTRSERVTFDAGQFYLPAAVTDAFGNTTTLTYDDDALFVTTVTDALGNEAHAAYDHRTLQPSQLTDPNGNRSFAAFDALGRTTAIAIAGKEGETDPAAQGDTLDHPTQWFTYDAFAWANEGRPVSVHAYAREEHYPVNPSARIQERVAYSDGSGNVLVEKVLAEPGLAPSRDQNGELVLDNGELVLVDTSPNPRWVGTGRTVLDNKGNPVKQYEPFFSDRSDYEDEPELVVFGVTPLLHYDPLGRLIRTDFPNGTYARVETMPWHTESWDPSDTVMDSTWRAERIGYAGGDPALIAERRAAELTSAHANTPTVTHRDVLARDVVLVEHLRDDNEDDVFLTTRTGLDVSGNALEVIDARSNTAEARTFDMLGRTLTSTSVDAGNRWLLADIAGAPLRSWNSRGFTSRFVYDALRRPTHAYVTPEGQSERLVTRTLFGESVPSPEATNLRTHVFRVYDSAGVTTSTAYDFKGNLVQGTRRLTLAYQSTPDWLTLDTANPQTPSNLAALAEPLLEAETFTSTNAYDALGRVTSRTTPDASETLPTYNEAGLLESIDVRIRDAETATTFVSDFDYNARGQRLRCVHGNGTITTYAYDPLTFRLTRLRLVRNSDSAVLQDLRYTYDPTGNITQIRDLAQQTVYFDNSVVTPDQLFEYDALGRLTFASGREHASNTQPTHADFAFGPQPHPDDPTALRTYEERYTWDAVGNILALQHTAQGGNFTRQYVYANNGNRLLANSAPGETTPPFSHSYTYDAHGNMTAMPHLAALAWDHADRLQHADLGGGGDVWFVYDGAGNRVRKVQVNQAGTLVRERVYLGDWEVWREHSGNPLELEQERQTLHVIDDNGRLCLVETLTVDESEPVETPTPLQRHQHGNHLGSAALELDENAAIISYEEFHPFGTTSYAANDSGIEVSPKHYRYIGKERDAETGLDHMGARYYAPWLGRWTAADPIGIVGGINLYQYSDSTPINLQDPSGTAPRDSYSGYTIPLERPQLKVDGPVTGGVYSFDDDEVKSTSGQAKGDQFIEGDEPGYNAIENGGPEDPEVILEKNKERKARNDDAMSTKRLVKARDERLVTVGLGTARIMSEATPVGTGLSVDEALGELYAARTAYEQDPSEENEARLQSARSQVRWSLIPAWRLGRGMKALPPARSMKALPPARSMKALPPATAAGGATRAISPNRLNHIFGKAEHALDDFVAASGGREAAFNRIQDAANAAARAGRIPTGPNGIIPSGNAGPIIDVGGTQIRLIGGRVVDGVVEISSASRRGLP